MKADLAGRPQPIVSLVTSWHIPLKHGDDSDSIPGMQKALEAGITHLDLYFLDNSDIPIYNQMLLEGRKKEKSLSSASDFASLLQRYHDHVHNCDRSDCQDIADELVKGMTKHFQGKLVGRRPQFVALATHFPNVSSLDEVRRRRAVRAVRSALAIAYHLGCRCVEIVGGSRGYSLDIAPPADLGIFIARVFEQFAKSLKEIYSTEDENTAEGLYLNPLKTIAKQALPIVAIELEPGTSFLINSLTEYKRLRNLLDSATRPYVNLNLDIAHSFLLDYSYTHYEEYRGNIAHIHIADHAGHGGQGGAHASDLPPGQFHRKGDYEPWLKFSKTLPLLANTGQPSGVFSNAMAVELEACNSLGTVMEAIHKVRSWLNEIASERELLEVKGAIVTIDIGHSTQMFLSQKNPRAQIKGANRIKGLIEKLSRHIFDKGGSIMSYTGDGFIALFEEHHSRSKISEMLEAVVGLEGEVRQYSRSLRRKNHHDDLLSLRVGLHWGSVYIPTKGTLRDQAIGRDVVCSTRLCDWLGKIIEPALPQNTVALFGMTDAMFANIPAEDTKNWLFWKDTEFKGIVDASGIYLHKNTGNAFIKEPPKTDV